jgi:hypothetical protein
LRFRLIVQPTVAIILALLAGWRDARAGRPAFFWAVVRDPPHRLYLLQQGWKDVGRLFLIALALDVIYQLYVLHWIYLGEALLVAMLLAFLPYLILRGPANRITARSLRLATTSPVVSVPGTANAQEEGGKAQ